MTLLRRRPREVYRVYSEEEYLNGAELDIASIAEWQLGESPLGESPLGESPVGEASLSVETAEHQAGGEHRLRRGMKERRLHRMAGVAMLVAAVGTVGGVIFLNVTRAHGAGAQGSLLAATSSSRVARSPAVNDAQPQVGSSRQAIVDPVKTTPRSRVIDVRRSLGVLVPRRSNPRRANHLLTHPLPVRRRTDVAVVADHGHRPSSGEVSAVPASASTQMSTATASVSAAPARPAREKRAEFGFER
jgi:hypothetical protein